MAGGTVLHCTVLNYTVMHWLVLYYTELHCTALHCTELNLLYFRFRNTIGFWKGDQGIGFWGRRKREAVEELDEFT